MILHHHHSHAQALICQILERIDAALVAEAVAPDSECVRQWSRQAQPRLTHVGQLLNQAGTNLTWIMIKKSGKKRQEVQRR